MSKLVDALRRIQEDQTGESRPQRKIGRMAASRSPNPNLEDTAVLPEGSYVPSRMVHVDHDAMREEGLIAPEAERMLFEDEYRVIKRPILRNAFGPNAAGVENGYVVLITSALSGDGKTFTCINLALSIAREQDTSVMLVDADMRKPHISTLFDTQDEIGILDYLDGSVSDLSEIEIATDVDGLTIVPTGQPRPNSTELLSSSRMDDFIDAVHRHDPRKVILIDSSPLLQTTESRALAATAGQLALVVRAGITPKGAVTDAIAAVDTTKPVNLILNQVRFGGGQSAYHGGHYGGYGYGSSSSYGDSNVRENQES